jgi:hypothetical protein
MIYLFVENIEYSSLDIDITIAIAIYKIKSFQYTNICYKRGESDFYLYCTKITKLCVAESFMDKINEIIDSKKAVILPHGKLR